MTRRKVTVNTPLATPVKRTRGERVVAFIERYCKVPAGDLLPVGSPLKLLPFQKKFILDIYDNPFGTQRAYLSIARKNGKTALIAGIVLAHLLGPEARQNSQIVSGAMSREQAGIVFELARKMVEMSPELSRVTRIIPSTKRLFGLVRNVEYKALSAEGKTAHGLSPILAILDEVGQVQGPRSPFISAVTTSQGAYKDPLLIAISTQAPTDADLFSTWIDAQKSAPNPRVVSHVYSAPEDCALDDIEAWKAANPALGIFRSQEDVEKEAQLAIDMPANESEFRNLYLNQRVESASPFVSKTVWEANAKPATPYKNRTVFGGLDLAQVNDLCAFVLVDQDDGSVNCAFWLPKQNLSVKARKDRVPWDLWEKEGLLYTTPGAAVEYKHVAKYLRDVFNSCNVTAIGFDRYHMRHLRPWLVEAGFTDEELERFKEFGQGTQSMTPALRALEVKLLNHELKHGDNKILKMCAANARVVGDSGARKFDKRKSRGRIDGMVALAMAVGVMPEKAVEEKKFQILFV
jgi:phage terminase large subunit-like protein